MDIIRIDPKEIINYQQEGGKLVFKPSAEFSLIQLLKAKDFIDEQIDLVKKSIETAGLSISPGFKGVIGEKVKAIYRVYGDKYDIINEKVDRQYIKTTITEKIDTDAVDEYMKKHKELPFGIVERQRAPQISISLKKEPLLTD